MDIPKLRTDESLAMWRRRLEEELHLDHATSELLRVVSIESYCLGTHDMSKAFLGDINKSIEQ